MGGAIRRQTNGGGAPPRGGVASLGTGGVAKVTGGREPEAAFEWRRLQKAAFYPKFALFCPKPPRVKEEVPKSRGLAPNSAPWEGVGTPNPPSRSWGGVEPRPEGENGSKTPNFGADSEEMGLKTAIWVKKHRFGDWKCAFTGV